MNRIRLGLPKGSLNDPRRANTSEVLSNAGYEVRGYEPGMELDEILILNDPEIQAFLTRPQASPMELRKGLLDIAITGEDWVQENSTGEFKGLVRKIGDLEYGAVRLVVASPEDAPYASLADFFRSLRGRTKPILCFTEYINLTRQFFMDDEGYREVFGNTRPVTEMRGFIDGGNNVVQIISSDGATEAYMKKGADLIVDNSQTGDGLKRARLKCLEVIMESSAGLYAGPSCVDWKEEKARQIFEQLYGAITAKRFFDVKFNVPRERTEEVRLYLTSRGFCADEPTIVAGDRFSQVNVLIRKGRFPEMLGGIKQYGASAIVMDEKKVYIQ